MAHDPTTSEAANDLRSRPEKRKPASDGEGSVDGAEPSNKVRKVSESGSATDDAVAFARRALEMYKQEVQDDGDFEEPDTTPATTPKSRESSSKDASEISKDSDSKNAKEETTTTATARWQKIGRQPMISDDPSIL